MGTKKSQFGHVVINGAMIYPGYEPNPKISYSNPLIPTRSHIFISTQFMELAQGLYQAMQFDETLIVKLEPQPIFPL
jgi:hypothetical protein